MEQEHEIQEILYILNYNNIKLFMAMNEKQSLDLDVRN